MSDEYKRSCHDELNWIEIDQCHNAIMQISKSCFEFKKMCLGFLGVSLTFIIKFTENSLDHSLFIVALLICAGFWGADSTSYYFQRKVRGRVDKLMNEIGTRNEASSYSRELTCASWPQAFFNSSMFLYYFLFLSCLVGWICYFKGAIS